MAREKMCVVVVMDGYPDRYEVIVPLTERFSDYDYREVCEKAVRITGKKADRKKPVPVTVSLFKLDIRDGEMKRFKIGDWSIMPPLEPRTAEEYGEELAAVLQSLPPEFQAYVRSKSYEDGHASGYEECLNIAGDMADELQPVIEAYRQRILSEQTAGEITRPVVSEKLKQQVDKLISTLPVPGWQE